MTRHSVWMGFAHRIEATKDKALIYANSKLTYIFRIHKLSIDDYASCPKGKYIEIVVLEAPISMDNDQGLQQSVDYVTRWLRGSTPGLAMPSLMKNMNM